MAPSEEILNCKVKEIQVRYRIINLYACEKKFLKVVYKTFPAPMFEKIYQNICSYLRDTV